MFTRSENVPIINSMKGHVSPISCLSFAIMDSDFVTCSKTELWIISVSVTLSESWFGAWNTVGSHIVFTELSGLLSF